MRSKCGQNSSVTMDTIDSFARLHEAKGFKIAHLNIRSIMKIDQIRMCIQDSDIDVFSVSETWLKPHSNTLSGAAGL